MKTFITLRKEYDRELPDKFKNSDFRMPESLIRYFLNKYTKEGDKVLDMFAGFGTTLVVAEEMNRIPFGIEYRKEFCEYIKSILKNKENIIHGDALKLNKYKFPKMDFSITSPPYMNKDDVEFALTSYTTKGTYIDYLKGLKEIYIYLKLILKPNAYNIIEVANLKRNGITTLAWDIAREISKVFQFSGEVIICWEKEESSGEEGTYGYGYDHSYCLIFRNT